MLQLQTTITHADKDLNQALTWINLYLADSAQFETVLECPLESEDFG